MYCHNKLFLKKKKKSCGPLQSHPPLRPPFPYFPLAALSLAPLTGIKTSVGGVWLLR